MKNIKNVIAVIIILILSWTLTQGQFSDPSLSTGVSQAELNDTAIAIRGDIPDSVDKALKDADGSTISSTYETVTNVGLIGDDTANFKTAFGWGDHSTQNYLDNDDAHVDTAGWNEAYDSVAAWLNKVNDAATDADFQKVADDSTALLAAKDSVAAWDNGSLISGLETVANVAKIGDDTAAFIAAKDSVAAWDNGALLTDYSTTAQVEALIEDSLNEYSLTTAIQAFVGDTADVVRTEIRDSVGVITDLDSANVSANGLAESDMNWGSEYIYLDLVHGWGRALEDSSWLNFPQHDGSASFLALGYAGDITAPHKDTFFVSGYIPYACTIDSLHFCMKETGSGAIDEYNLYGPDLSSATNMADSLWEALATDQSGAAWAVKRIDLNETASKGDRFSIMFIYNYAADYDSIYLGWVRLEVQR